ncbi:general secretion pathway protein GspB [uncultured Photobacterium sp.]|uniref:general secretion pathway protein GspB n=1 Tax=uncultured Photobacterium sp. TaxID=173973 RepID=UPI002611CB69|nr:general secretion pathway protein GspB [uncultured Photobacterium sp.]
MSNLLNAIAQSEQQYQVYSSQPSQPVRSATTARQLSSWLLPALLVAVPVAGTLAYSQWRSVEITEVAEIVPAAVIQAKIEAPKVMPAPVMVKAGQTETYMDETLLLAGESTIRLLPYPELRTEPLPSLNHLLSNRAAVRSVQPAAVPANNQPVSKTKTVSAEAADNDWNLDELDYSELSPQLAEQLKSAIAATDGDEPPVQPEEPSESALAQQTEPEIKAIALGELPASVQSRIPSLDFQTHIYSSTANSRWVKVNGREAFEGDEIAPGVTLRRIEPRQVVFDFESYLVSMPSLSEW